MGVGGWYEECSPTPSPSISNIRPAAVPTPDPNQSAPDRRASTRPSPAFIALCAFLLIATLLPFALVSLPFVGIVPVATLVLIAFHGCWLANLRSHPARPCSLELAILGLIGVAIVAFGLGVAAYGMTREAGFGAFNFVVGALATIGVLRMTAQAELRLVGRLLLLAGGVAALIGVGLWALPTALAERFLLLLTPLGYPEGPELIRIVYGTDLERAIGTSVDANLFGGLMLVVTVLVAGQLLARERLLQRPILIGIGLLAVAALTLSFSRSAWVGTGVALVALALLLERRALILVAVAAVIVAVVPQLRERIGGAIMVQDAATLLRVDEYRASTALIAEHPLFGVGFGPASGLNLVRRVSNMYLLIAEELGLIGVAALVAVLGFALHASLRRVDPRAPDAGLRAGLAAALLGCLVIGLFDHYFINSLFPHTTGLFFVLVGLTIAAARPELAPRD